MTIYSCTFDPQTTNLGPGPVPPRAQAKIVSFVLAIVALGRTGAADVTAAPGDENWGQWRGPLQNGVAPHADPPVEWSETKNVKWKFKLPGEGSSTPVIWTDLVFVQSAIPAAKKSQARLEGLPLVIVPQFAAQQQSPREGERRGRPGGPGVPGAPGGPRGFGGGGPPTTPFQFTMTALNRITGKPVWQKMLRETIPHEGHHPSDGTFASSSPVADAEGVFAYFGSRGLYALDHQGNLRWQKDLGQQRIKMAFGEGSSPPCPAGSWWLTGITRATILLLLWTRTPARNSGVSLATSRPPGRPRSSGRKTG